MKNQGFNFYRLYLGAQMELEGVFWCKPTWFYIYSTMEQTLQLRIPSRKKQTKKEFSNGIPAFGTDAVRFTFTALASFGRDIKFDLKRVEGYRNFCNKLQNASRFVLMNLESQSVDFNAELSIPDKWILSSIQRNKIEVEKHLNDYQLYLMNKNL